MSDLSNKIIGEGLCIEGLEVEKLEKELEELKKLLLSKKMICPYCLKELKPWTYKGYYDTFDYWCCGCEKLPNPEIGCGSYV